MPKQEIVRQKIIDKYLQNPVSSYASIAKFVKESRHTVRNVILRFIETKSVGRKAGSGRKVGFKDKISVSKVVRSMRLNPGLSVRDLAKKHTVSIGLVQKIKTKYGYRTYKAQAVPNRNDAQNIRAKTRARKLLDRELANFEGCVLMDDETLIKADFNQMPHQQYYVAKSKGGVSKIFTCKKKDKFAKKYMVWMAICTCGRSSSFYVTNGIINTDIYIKECLQKRLLSLYRSHDVPPIFWPDLASCHYSRQTLQWYEDNEVRFVPKEHNPPNSPEVRPVEKFWAIVKRNLIKRFKPAKNIEDFKLKWKKAVGMVGNSGVITLMERLRQKVRALALGKQ